jgi:uncharacterized protein (TIGR02453 family)
VPYPPETLRFLAGLAQDNSRAWFEAHRDLYEAGYLAAGAAFVGAMGPRLREISPGVQWEPKVGGSLMRIFRDTRFSKDKRPYKDHLDHWFWHGARKGWDAPGFYMRITPERIWIGAGMHHFDRPVADRYRAAVVDPVAGRALEAAVAAARDAGLAVGEATRKRVPAGFDARHERAGFLLHDSLYANAEWPAEAATQPGFEDRAFAAFRAGWPVGQWLLDWV